MAIRGPLTGVRVLDLSQAHAGPIGTQILGDMGAEVIKIESLRGDALRWGPPQLHNNPQIGYYALALNRNKRGITLDLYSPSGKEAFYDLVKVSDVVFDNFRAGSLERMGADYETLSQINPRIICASITGYGPSGPYSHLPSADDIAQAISGMVSLCGEPGGRPMRAPSPFADISSGLFAVIGVLAALHEREHTGRGRKVEVNLLDSCMYVLSNHYQNYFISGRVPQPQGSIHPVDGTFGFHKTKDGYISLMPCWSRIARVISKEWMVDDPRFADLLTRAQHRNELQGEIEEALQQAGTADWVELCHAQDIAAAPVNTFDKVIEDPQVVHNKAVIEMEHPQYGKIKAIDCPIKMPGAIEGEKTAPPLIGEHTEEVLSQVLGYSEERIASIVKEGEEHFQELQDTKLRKLL